MPLFNNNLDVPCPDSPAAEIIPASNQGSFQPSQALLVLAYGLVGAGLLVVGVVLLAAYETFSDPLSHNLVSNFSKQLATHPLIFSMDASHIEIGDGAAQIVAMFIFLLFAGLAGFIGISLIRAGVQVVSPSTLPQLEEMKKRLETLVQRIRR